MKKILRFHKEIYFPEWFGESMDNFIEDVNSRGSLSFSLHAVERIVDYCTEYGKVLFRHISESINKSSITSDKIFEFYSIEKEIKKVCYRFELEKFPIDLIVVLSHDGTIITVFVSNKGDYHKTLNNKLYEKGV